MLEDFISELKAELARYRSSEVESLIACQGGDQRHEQLRGRIAAADAVTMFVSELIEKHFTAEDDRPTRSSIRTGRPSEYRQIGGRQ